MFLIEPTAAIIAGALTLPPLLLLYMLKLRRRPVRVSTIMFWPAAAADAQANEPFQRIRPSWLLLLHLLILLLLCAALGRPAIRTVEAPGERVVLLVDASASMNAIDPGESETRFERGKARAREIASDLFARGQRSVAVVRISREPTIVAPYSNSRAITLAAIDGILPSDQPGKLVAAVRLAESLDSDAAMEESPGGDGGDDDGEGVALARPRPDVIVVSDGSFEEEQSGAAIGTIGSARFERIGPSAGANATITDGAGAGGAGVNVGIVAIAATRDEADAGLVRVFVEILNTGPARTVPVECAIGSVVERVAVSLQGGGRTQANLSVRWPGEGVLRCRLGVDDALATDNVAALVMDEPTRAEIVLVRPEGVGPGVEGSAAGSLPAGAYLLEDTLRELRPARLEIVSARAWPDRAGSISREQIVIADRVLPSPLPNCNTIFFGAVPELPGLRVTEQSPVLTRAMIWDRRHPALSHITLDQFAATVSRRLEISEGGAGTPRFVAKELARGRGTLLLVEHEMGGVRRLVTPFSIDDSNWALLAGFPIFLLDATDYLSPRGSGDAGRGFTTAETVSVRTNGLGGSVTLTREDETLVRTTVAGERVVRVGMMTRAGVYAVSGRDGAERAVAVNLLDAHESAIGAPLTLEIGARPVEASAAKRGVRELWPMLLLLGCVLLVIEWFAYGRTVRA